MHRNEFIRVDWRRGDWREVYRRGKPPEHQLTQLREKFPISANTQNATSTLLLPLLPSISMGFYENVCRRRAGWSAQSTGKYICGLLNDKISNQQKSHRATRRFSATGGNHPTIFRAFLFRSRRFRLTYNQSFPRQVGATTTTTVQRQRRRRRARRRMRRVVGKRWSQTKGGKSEQIVVKKYVIAMEFDRTETQESRKSLIRCSRQRNSSFAESRGKGEERAREKGWPSRCIATRSGIKNSLRLRTS